MSNEAMQFQSNYYGYSPYNYGNSSSMYGYSNGYGDFGNSFQGTNYYGDIMLNDSIFNFQPTSENEYQQSPQQEASQPQIEQTRIENPDSQNDYTEDFKEQVLAQNPNLRSTNKGNIYATTDKGKVYGTSIGLATPLLTRTIKGAKAGSYKGLFKFKPLAIVTLATTLIGLGIGYIVDKTTNANRAKYADSPTLAI